MYTPYVRISTGNPYTVLDASAKNALGALYSPPAPEGLVTTTNGFGAQPVMKYVLYNSTANPAPVGAPAPVYWIDETFTAVSGVESEGLGVNFVAGYLLPNTTVISGLTATELNESYVWIQVGGFIGAAIVPASTAKGDAIIGKAGNWTNDRIAAGSAILNKIMGFAASAAATFGALYTADIQMGAPGCFWGS